MKLTEPEALVWAAAFVARLFEREDADAENAVLCAHGAVAALRSVRVRGRHQQAQYATLQDFMMYRVKEDE